jgi:hypothetical protein
MTELAAGTKTEPAAGTTSCKTSGRNKDRTCSQEKEKDNFWQARPWSETMTRTDHGQQLRQSLASQIMVKNNYHTCKGQVQWQ